jgi:hypothetical protein
MRNWYVLARHAGSLLNEEVIPKTLVWEVEELEPLAFRQVTHRILVPGQTINRT